MIDAEARDKILQNLELITGRLEFIVGRITTHDVKTGKFWPEQD